MLQNIEKLCDKCAFFSRSSWSFVLGQRVDLDNLITSVCGDWTVPGKFNCNGYDARGGFNLF